MTDIIDLDELVGPPKRVKLGGQEYTLPAQLPVATYLRLRAEEKAAAEFTASGEEDPDSDRRVEDLHDLLLDLFRVHQPDLEELPGGLVQLFTVIPLVYGAGSVDEEEGDEDVPKPSKATRARTGSASTRKTPRSRSRS